MLFIRWANCSRPMRSNRSRKNITELMDIRPDFANVRRNGVEEEVDPDEVAVGELIVVKPGERIPLDGVIVKAIPAWIPWRSQGKRTQRGALRGRGNQRLYQSYGSIGGGGFQTLRGNPLFPNT